MAELGLIASVLQVAGAGLKLSRTLYDYADAVATADRRIRDIAKEIQLTTSILDELGNLFQQNDISSLLSKNALRTADETLRECSALFTEVDTALAKTTKNTFGRLAFPFRGPKVELLRSQIDKLKSTLQLLMQVLTYAHQVATQRLDREAEKAQLAEIKAVLLNKKKSTKIYMESLRRLRLSDSNDGEASWEEDGNRGMRTTSMNNSTAIKVASISSTITFKTLESCVDHIRSVLGGIEDLQKTLSDQGSGMELAERHQKVIGSYFRARNHLDSVLLGSSKAPSEYKPTTLTKESERLATFGSAKPPTAQFQSTERFKSPFFTPNPPARDTSPGFGSYLMGSRRRSVQCAEIAMRPIETKAAKGQEYSIRNEEVTKGEEKDEHGELFLRPRREHASGRKATTQSLTQIEQNSHSVKAADKDRINDLNRMKMEREYDRRERRELVRENEKTMREKEKMVKGMERKETDYQRTNPIPEIRRRKPTAIKESEWRETEDQETNQVSKLMRKTGKITRGQPERMGYSGSARYEMSKNPFAEMMSQAKWEATEDQRTNNPVSETVEDQEVDDLLREWTNFHRRDIG